MSNTGATFGALNEQRGALHDLVVNADRTFDATASRDRELAETIRIFPTFLDESKATVERVARFSTNPARDQRPEGPGRRPGPDRALAGRARAGPEAPVRRPEPADQRIRGRAAGADGDDEGARAVPRECASVLPAAKPDPVLLQLPPAHDRRFITNGGADLVGTWGTGRRGQTQIGILADPKNFTAYSERPPFERGNAYLQPNALNRAIALGGFESFDCNPSGGEVPNAQDAEERPAAR